MVLAWCSGVWSTVGIWMLAIDHYALAGGCWLLGAVFALACILRDGR